MIELDGFGLLRPLWLLAIPASLALAFVAVRRAGGVGDWRRAIDPHLFDALARRGVVVAGRGRSGLLAALAAALIALALVGPAIERPGVQNFRNLDAAIVAVDVSRSVADSGEFQDAKIAALGAAQAAGSRQVSVLVFAGDAYLANPPTTDRRTIETTLAALDAQTVPDVGSAPSRALALAHRTLRDSGVVGGDVVLISDGGGLDEGAQNETRSLVADGHRVSALYVTSAAATPKRAMETGRPELEALAALGGGAFATVGAPDAVYAEVQRSTAGRLGPSPYASLAWLDFGRALLLFAAAPLLLMFRRGG